MSEEGGQGSADQKRGDLGDCMIDIYRLVKDTDVLGSVEHICSSSRSRGFK